MLSGLRASLSFDAFDIDFEVDLGEVWATFQGFSERVDEVRAAEAEGLGGSEPLRVYIRCPLCDADATHLGSMHLPDRKVRLCTRCHSLFEVV